MNNKFSNLDELIQFIETAPFKEVDEFLKSHGVISNEIKQTIEALSDSFQRESENKYASWVESVIEEYHYLDINNPEHFSLLITLTLNEQAYLLAQHALFHVEMDRRKKCRLEFVYLHYNFVEKHLENLLIKYEGFVCSTDKTRWLIETYTQYLISGDLPDIKERSFYHPKHGDVGDWMSWITSMYELYYGNEEEYVRTKAKISKSYESRI